MIELLVIVDTILLIALCAYQYRRRRRWQQLREVVKDDPTLRHSDTVKAVRDTVQEVEQ